MSIGRNKPKPAQEASVRLPMLQWANGRTEGKPHGIPRFSGFVGWHVEQGQDTALDAALRLNNTATVTIRHPRQGADPVEKLHWNLGETVTFYPLTSGFPFETFSASMRDPDACASAGIGLKWDDEARRSRMVLYGYIKLAVPNSESPFHLVMIPAKGRITEEFFAAYMDHLRVLEAADEVIDRQKHPASVEFHEIGIPLTAGAEKSFGKTDTTVVVPVASAHSNIIDAAYLRTVWASIPAHQIENDWPLVRALAHDFIFRTALADSQEA